MSGSPIINLLSNISSGLFVLGTMWFKYWLDNKKSNTDIKKLALDAYEVFGKIPTSLVALKVACENLEAHPDFDAFSFQKDVYNDSSEILIKLDIMIVGHLEKIKQDFNKVEVLLIQYRGYLLNIINDSYKARLCKEVYVINVNDINIKNKDFIDKIVPAINSIKNKLDKEYINPIKTNITLRRCFHFLRKKLKIFFS